MTQCISFRIFYYTISHTHSILWCMSSENSWREKCLNIEERGVHYQNMHISSRWNANVNTVHVQSITLSRKKNADVASERNKLLITDRSRSYFPVMPSFSFLVISIITRWPCSCNGTYIKAVLRRHLCFIAVFPNLFDLLPKLAARCGSLPPPPFTHEQHLHRNVQFISLAHTIKSEQMINYNH